MGVLGGVQKVYAEKVYVLFLSLKQSGCSGLPNIPFCWKSPAKGCSCLTLARSEVRDLPNAGFSLASVWCTPRVGDRKSLSIAKNHPKPSQDFLDNSDLPLTKSSVLVGVHPKKFTRTSPKTWEDKFLGRHFRASKGGHATTRFLERFLEGALGNPCHLIRKGRTCARAERRGFVSTRGFKMVPKTVI